MINGDSSYLFLSINSMFTMTIAIKNSIGLIRYEFIASDISIEVYDVRKQFHRHKMHFQDKMKKCKKQNNIVC